MNYGAFAGEDNIDRHRESKSAQCSESRCGRLTSASTILLSIMSATVLFLFWDEYRAKLDRTSDIQLARATKFKEIRMKLRSNFSERVKGFSNRQGNRSSLVAYDQQSDSNYAEDMRDGAKFLPSPSQLLLGATAAQCSDSVAWGRCAELCNEDPCHLP